LTTPLLSDLWLKDARWEMIPPDLVQRLKRLDAGLKFLVVAEDWLR
jgi:hypothetical protein